MKKGRLFKTLRAIIITIFSVWTLFPLYWLLNTSLKTNRQVLQSPPSFFPAHVVFSSYTYVFSNFGVYFVNSIITALGSTFLSVIVGVLAAYSLSRFKFPKGFVAITSFIILAVRMMLPIVFIVPLFQIFRQTNLYNTHIGLIFAYTLVNMPFVVWLMTSYFQEIPHALDEAALIDGCGRLKTLWAVIIPLASPGIATTAVMAMIFTWNDLIFGLYLTSNSQAMTLPVSIIGFLSQYQTYWSQMAAAGVVAIVPMVIFLLFVQKYLVRGLTVGGVK